MARAYPAAQPQDYGPDAGGDWQNLRSELVALLEEVEGQMVRYRREDGIGSLAERVQDIRHQMAEPDPDLRHRDALRSVKRAVDRYSDRYEEPPPYPARPANAPANPRDTLQSAINQIRSRQAAFDSRPDAGREVYRDTRPAPTIDAPRFDELAKAVGGISARLERLEGELRGAAKIQTGNVKEIAEQVGQLSHVVELLAGAVGETGQVKRLESQIAGLAKLVAQGPQVDMTALTTRLDGVGNALNRLLENSSAPSSDGAVAQRLDDVSETVGRLADLQVQFANKVDMSAQTSSGLKDSLRSIEGAIHAIEDGVRNVYDRIDAIERTEALPPAALERVTEELARVTETLQQPVDAEGMAQLLQLVEALHKRISALESPSLDVGELKLDMDALRSTVSEAVEPRFAAIEMQLEALNERVATTPGADISVSQLEAQVRQLVARMDQTGEQLTGLARLYSQPAERNVPDLEALADMVASRTSQSISQSASHQPLTAMSGSDIDEIERRVSRLVGSMRNERVSDDLAGIESSIRAVNERLARLEVALDRPGTAADAPDDMMPEPFGATRPQTAPDSVKPSTDPIARLLDEAADAATNEAKGTLPKRSDAMPADPSADAPLRDKPFGPDVGAVRAALEAKNGPRKQHPGLADPPPATGAPAKPPSPFDPSSVERPPRPVSSLDGIGASPGGPRIDEPPIREGEDPGSASTNTFIAAARRAAMRQRPPEPAPTSNSLIARAFASFQAGKTAESGNAAPTERSAPATKEKKRGFARLLAGDKEPRTKWAPKDEPPATATATEAIEPVEESSDRRAATPDASEDAPRESFLSRHRRPILLAASLVAIAFLTLNLINQRLAEADAAASASVPAPEPTVETSAVEATTPSPLLGEPIANAEAAVTGPRVIPIVDSLSTASIDPAAAKGFTAMAEDATPNASAFSAASPSIAAAEALETASISPQEPLDELESPVQVEMPPEALGPQALREAAANGDARAQFEIAAIYTEGRAVPEDLAAAAIWYERSAAQGFAPAQYRLGNLYENGRGVPKDLHQARLWYQRAAEAGNRMAMHNLAALYAGGQLGKQEFDAAAQWFEQAARRGMRDSQFNLGMLYARGLGVEQDLEASYKWFSLAALRGDADAAKARDDVARSLDAEAVGRLNDEVAAFVLADIDLAANYAPIGTWSDSFDPGKSIANGEVIKSVQAALNALGFPIGTPDGIMGPKTAEAIRAFERGTGMSESGAVNPRLLAVLGSQPV